MQLLQESLSAFSWNVVWKYGVRATFKSIDWVHFFLDSLPKTCCDFSCLSASTSGSIFEGCLIFNGRQQDNQEINLHPCHRSLSDWYINKVPLIDRHLLPIRFLKPFIILQIFCGETKICLQIEWIRSEMVFIEEFSASLEDDFESVMKVTILPTLTILCSKFRPNQTQSR